MGVAFMMGFGGFDGLAIGDHLALYLLVLENTAQRGHRDGSDAFGGAVSVMTATGPLPLFNSTPFVRHPEN